ncbi:MAG: pectate lyase [Bacteroidetes bacterium]|nr:pectate lyase [Bacteroidota bacterium]
MKSFFLAGFMLASASLFAADLYVSPSGNDAADGSVSAPKATLSAALRDARNLRRLHKVAKEEAIHIILKGGIYFQYEPVYVRPEDNGTESSPTIIEAAAGELPVLSGGMKVTGWKKQGKFWVADMPDFNGCRIHFRQLWINGQKAVRARNVADFTQMPTIRSVDKPNEMLWVPAASVRNIAKAPHAELVIHQMWAIANLRIKSIVFRGDSAGIKFHNPESKVQFDHPWPSPTIGKPFNKSAFYLTNAIQLLDHPGEWFYDQDNGKLYYMPRPGEDMRKAEAIVPAIETVVDVEGTPERPVQYITFKGIGFNHTTWTRPSEKGHVPIQSGMYIIEGYKIKPHGALGNENKGLDNQDWLGRQPAAVTMNNVQNIVVENCRFERLGATGLDMVSGCRNSDVEGCLFRDIAGNGIATGFLGDNALETHMPYDPADERVLCVGQRIVNNYVTDVANEDWSCAGIAAGFVRNIAIEHNELYDLPYMGISLGWGWTKSVNCMHDNRVYANYVHRYATKESDVAGIYTLSVQPRTMVIENVVDSCTVPPYVHDPDHWFYLYTDEGSSFITLKDNWTPSEKYLKNANGPGNTWENNGPQVSDSIKSRAGLEQKYLYLKKL